MRILIIALVFLSSCATKNLNQRIKVSENDTFKSETYLRYTKERLKDQGPLSEELYACYNQDYSKAFELLKNNLDKNLENPAYWNTYGICYFLKNDYVRADYFFNLSLTYSKKKFLPAYNNLGISALKRNDLEQALEYFQILEKKSHLIVPRYNRAQIYLEYGKVELALKELQSLRKLNTNDPDINISIGIAYLLDQKPQEAERYLNPLFKGEFDKTDKIFYKALLLFEQEKWQEVKDILEAKHFTRTLDLKRFAKKMLVIATNKLKEAELKKRG